MLVLVLSLAFAQGAEPTREAQVLELVLELERTGAGPHRIVHFPRVEAPLGAGRAYAARAPFLCGNSDQGSFDDGAARALVRRIGAIYGLHFEPDVERRFGAARAVLDGLDLAAGVGFELRGRRSEGRAAGDEPLEDTLDEFEWRVLAGQGVRVHVDDARRFRVWDGSDFCARMAYLAGVVAFLNEVTEGEDVEFGGFCFEQEARWQPAEIDASGARLAPLAPPPEGARWLEFRLEEPGTVRLHYRGRAELLSVEDNPFLTELSGRTAAQRSWVGDRRAGPSLLALALHSEPLEEGNAAPDWRLHWRQERAGRELEVQASPGSDLLFLPGAADLGEPFTLALELTPGVYRIYESRLGVSALPWRVR